MQTSTIIDKSIFENRIFEFNFSITNFEWMNKFNTKIFHLLPGKVGQRKINAAKVGWGEIVYFGYFFM